MKRARGRPNLRKIGYNREEEQRANHSLTQSVENGTLKWLKVKFEHYPLEAVPNLWEGDDGMMKLVPKFPMPPLIVPEAPAATESDKVAPATDNSKKPAEIGADNSEASDQGEMDTSKPVPEATEKPKKPVGQRVFWLRMAKVFIKLDNISKSVLGTTSKLYSEHEIVRKQTCQQLSNLYKKLQAIKEKLDVAEEEYTTNGYINLFKVMPLHAKFQFKKYHGLEGRLPDNLKCIEKKYDEVKGKIRNVIHKHTEQLLPFKEVISSILTEVLSKTNEKDIPLLKLFGSLGENENGTTEGASENPVAATDAEGGKLQFDDEDDDDDELGAGKPKKRKSIGPDEGNAVNGVGAESKAGTQVSGAVLTKEDQFWANLAALRRRINNAVISLGKVEKIVLPELSKINKATSLSYCKQVLFVHRKITTYTRNLASLTEEMQAEQYEDRKIFSGEDLTSLGVENLSADDSLKVVEAMFNSLKAAYLKLRSDKRELLERCGYSGDPNVISFPTEHDVQLMRVCAHSKTEINLISFYRLDDGPKESTPEGQQESEAKTVAAGIDATNGETAASHQDAAGTGVPASGQDSSVAAEGIDADPTADDDASDESEMDDTTDVNKSVNSLGFFMKNLGPDAFSVTELSSSMPAEEFIEKERKHWDRLQKLLRKIDKTLKQLHFRYRNLNMGKKQARTVITSLHDKVKHFTRTLEQEKTESNRCGYCKHVTYQNLEYHQSDSMRLLVKNLDQVKDRLDNLAGSYKEVARKLGLAHMLRY